MTETDQPQRRDPLADIRDVPRIDANLHALIAEAQAEAVRAAASAVHDAFGDAMVPLVEVVDLLGRCADQIEKSGADAQRDWAWRRRP